jgi:hypothetical protein
MAGLFPPGDLPEDQIDGWGRQIDGRRGVMKTIQEARNNGGRIKARWRWS